MYYDTIYCLGTYNCVYTQLCDYNTYLSRIVVYCFLKPRLKSLSLIGYLKNQFKNSKFKKKD